MEDSLTLLLTHAQNGDLGAEGRAIPLIYERLRAMARSLVGRERSGHTLQATALVSEFFIQKFRRISTPILDREHYYSLAARAMRQVLTDHARRNGAARRQNSPESIAELLMRVEDPYSFSEDHLAVQQVFRSLAKLDPTVAECIRLRVIEGLTIRQTAQQMNRPAWKVRDWYDFGLSWMSGRLDGSR